MKRLQRPEYAEDVMRICLVALRRGYELSYPEAEKVWQDYSDSMAAGWMTLPNDNEEIWNCISEIVEELEEEDPRC